MESEFGRRDVNSDSTAACLPNFMVVGAAKCGTTSLTHYLNQHPEVYVSPWKEPNFFVHEDEVHPLRGPAPSHVLEQLLHSHTVTDFEQYQALFRGVQSQRAIGEGSVRYLYFPNAAERIRRSLPDIKVIAILRHPVSRMVSHHSMMKQFHLEPLALAEAIAAESQRRQLHWGWDWHYTQVGLYSQQIQRYLDAFGSERVKVLLYDDYKRSPNRVFAEVCQFLEIESSFNPDMTVRQKVAYRPRFDFLDRWLQWPYKSRIAIESLLPRRLVRPVLRRIGDWNRCRSVQTHDRLSNRLRQDLTAIFRDDILALEELLQRKTNWLSETVGIETQ